MTRTKKCIFCAHFSLPSKPNGIFEFEDDTEWNNVLSVPYFKERFERPTDESSSYICWDHYLLLCANEVIPLPSESAARTAWMFDSKSSWSSVFEMANRDFNK